ncbi:MAG: hypothetical protein SVY53_05925 [Chloroflexota bacterium]|nr:hypothetical protein [Chloroflexota bacterium]
MNKDIVLVGAGSISFGLGTLGDILKSGPLEGTRVVLQDINQSALQKVNQIAQDYVKQNTLPYSIVATTSLKEALHNAGYCIIAIEVGDRFQLWEQDWKIPLQYGIRQVFGENGGPGGLFHALRVIPSILNICSDIQNLCPDAYVFGLSNPLIRISHAVHSKYPDLRYTGLCDLLGSPLEHLPILLETPFSNLSFKAGGFNHFSILVEVTYKDTGKDAYPNIRQRAPEYFSKAPACYGVIGERQLIVEVLDRFNYLPMTTDSHLGEYIHWAHKSVDHRSILEFYQSYRKSTAAPQPSPWDRIAAGSGSQHWRSIPIIEGILTNSHHEEIAVNVPNDGLIEYLPKNQIVEVPAIIDSQGIHGIQLPNYPKAFAGLLMNQVAVNDLTTEAVITGSKETILQALLVDPIIDDAHAAEEMLDAFLKLQQPYLSYIR